VRRFVRALIWRLVLVCLAIEPISHAQTPGHPKGYFTVIPIKGLTNDAIVNAASQPNQLPLWTFNVTAAASLGGGPFTGTMVGRSPFAHGKTTTTITLQIIPLIITITDSHGTILYDPTVPDPCLTGNPTDVQVIQNSPLFTNNNYTMNGVNVGNTQYIDAFQRASFWSLVGGTPYHLLFSPVLLPSFHVTYTNNTTVAANDPGLSSPPSCGHLGIIDINAFDANTNSFIQGVLKTQYTSTVNPGTFPMFLTRNVVFSDGPPLDPNSGCCILGYHSGYSTGPNLQIYSPFSLNTQGIFTDDIGTLSHEIAEAIDDPTGNNPTPVWGNVGQVLPPQGAAPTLNNGGCQNNLEVGDPLSDNGGTTPTHPFTVPGTGFTYHLQELTFFSWFFGGPSLGAGGKYSNNGTFSGPAIGCPPGGFQ